MARFTADDEQDLRWYFAGGLEAELSPPSIHESMVRALQGLRQDGPGYGAFSDGSERLVAAIARDRRVRSRLRRIRQRDPFAVRVLEAAYGAPLMQPGNPMLVWGNFAPVLLVSPLAEKCYLRSSARKRRSFLEWLVHLRADEREEPREMVKRIASEVDQLMSRAITAWERS